MPIGKVDGIGPDVIKPLPRSQVPKWFGPSCTNAHITNIRLPLLGTQPFHKYVAMALEYVFRDIAEHDDLALIDRADYGGVYNCRPVQGGAAPSPHSWAIAIDLNVHAFADGKRPQTNWHCKRSEIAQSLKALAIYFNAWGFSWGGHWNAAYLDPMHFEATEITRQLLLGGLPGVPDARARAVVKDARQAIDPLGPHVVYIDPTGASHLVDCDAKLKAGILGANVRQLVEALGFYVDWDGNIARIIKQP